MTAPSFYKAFEKLGFMFRIQNWWKDSQSSSKCPTAWLSSFSQYLPERREVRWVPYRRIVMLILAEIPLQMIDRMILSCGKLQTAMVLHAVVYLTALPKEPRTWLILSFITGKCTTGRALFSMISRWKRRQKWLKISLRDIRNLRSIKPNQIYVGLVSWDYPYKEWGCPLSAHIFVFEIGWSSSTILYWINVYVPSWKSANILHCCFSKGEIYSNVGPVPIYLLLNATVAR